MSGKFMKIKKLIIPTLTLAIMVSAMSGCSCSNQSELHKMIERGDSITIEVVEPDFEEQGTETTITWTELAKLMSYEDYRIGVDNALGVTSDGISKYGVIYIDDEGNQTGNATLYDAFLNKAFVDGYWNNETVQNQLTDGVGQVYADLEESDYNAAIINAYWNLLPDNQPNYFNGGSSLTRAEAMTLVMRATTPVTESGTPDENADFKTAVGDSDYTNYASYVAGNSYLTTSDKSLNNQTFNGTMTRGEYIYLLMANTFGVDTINNVDVSGIKLNDCKDGGNIAKAQEFSGKDYCKSYELAYALQNVDAGAPTSMYKAIVAAYKYEIISAETRWDEAITKTEAIDLFIETVQAKANLDGYKVDTESGAVNEETNTIKDLYNQHKESITIDETEFTIVYNNLISAGLYEDEVIDKILTDYSVNKEVETEAPTEAPTEEPTVPINPEKPVVKDYTISWSNPYFFTKKFSDGTEKYYFTYMEEADIFGVETTAIGIIPESQYEYLEHSPDYYINGKTGSNPGSTREETTEQQTSGNTSNNQTEQETQSGTPQLITIDGQQYMLHADGTLIKLGGGSVSEEEQQKFEEWCEEHGVSMSN